MDLVTHATEYQHGHVDITKNQESVDDTSSDVYAHDENIAGVSFDRCAGDKVRQRGSILSRYGSQRQTRWRTNSSNEPQTFDSVSSPTKRRSYLF